MKFCQSNQFFQRQVDVGWHIKKHFYSIFKKQFFVEVSELINDNLKITWIVRRDLIEVYHQFGA